jgi:hypothetical protein
VTAHLAEIPDPFGLVIGQELHCLDLLRNNGDNMDRCEAPHATGNHWSSDSYLEMEDTLRSLRSLICDLLKTNQELRTALIKASASLPHNEEL